MTEGEVLHWIKELPLGAAVRESRWLFAMGETLHLIGLCFMVGGLLIVDLRLLGFIRRVPMRAAVAFLPFVIFGFLINLATGIEFFMTDPFMYWPNPAFRLKMLLILLAGLNALMFTVMEHRRVLVPAGGKNMGAYVKLTAGPFVESVACRHSPRQIAAGVRRIDEIFLKYASICRAGKGALFAPCPSGSAGVGTRSLSSGRPKAGPVGFAHPAKLITRRTESAGAMLPQSPYRRVRHWNDRIARRKSILRNAGQFTSEK